MPTNEPLSPVTLQREFRWSGLRPGDPVVVNTPKERLHHYEFVAFVRNPATDDAWVEVRGGRRGERKDRSFRPELIFPPSARKGGAVGGQSLAEAPQLPW